MDYTEQNMSKPKAVAVATVIQVQAPTSAKPGDKALISADGTINGWVGGGCVQPAVLYATQEVMKSGQPFLLRVAPDGQWQPVAGLTDYASSCLGRGSLLLFIEPLTEQPRLCILGESVVARCLADQAVLLNLNVSLQGTGVSQNSTSSHLNVQIEPDCQQADFIVVATQGKGDKQAIVAALQSICPHILMVVSTRKLEALKEQLQQDGFDESAIARLKGPAGIHINAQLPEEIALSVLAEVIQLRRSNITTPEQTTKLAGKSVPGVATVDSKGGCCGGG